MLWNVWQWAVLILWSFLKNGHGQGVNLHSREGLRAAVDGFTDFNMTWVPGRDFLYRWTVANLWQSYGSGTMWLIATCLASAINLTLFLTKIPMRTLDESFYTGCPPQKKKKKNQRNARFSLLCIFEKYCIFYFQQIEHCLLKRMIPRHHWNWLSSVDSMVISQNTVIVRPLFSFILVTFQAGIMASLWLPYIVARTPIDPCEQNKERIYGRLYPP